MVASGKTSKFRVSGFKFRVEKLFGFLATQNAKLETKHYGVRWLDIALAFAGDRPGKSRFPLTNEKLRRVAALQRLRQAHDKLAALSDICPLLVFHKFIDLSHNILTELGSAALPLLFNLFQ